MSNEVSIKTEKSYSSAEKLRAAYALNMCTVSISQIVDYKDSYILEQEYEAILNNLNLKQMPKDEALLRILSEILNTITFFRIQDIKKNQIEKKYQQRMRNAIWSAIPSLSVVISGNPVAIASSIAAQVGSSYMNYRKEKCMAQFDKEDKEIELQITAIEQLNALRRELFTTAWRLADEYDFDDNLRITERQIKQYNEILMDRDDLRKYARLDSIKDKFIAYPPFWYFIGHTANCISQDNEDLNVKKYYSGLAKEHFEHFYSLSDCNILREDQITASFALEYIDILFSEQTNSDSDKKKIESLIKLAVEMSGNSLDILQLCAISYLKIGDTDSAAKLLKVLVNESYNTSVNAKLLSRLYVSKYIFGEIKDAEVAYVEYQTLSKMTDGAYLFPMPLSYPDKDDKSMADEKLEQNYIETQLLQLQKDYRFVLNEFIKEYIKKYNQLWPVPSHVHVQTDSYFDYTSTSKRKRLADIKRAFESDDGEDYVAQLRDSSFRINYLNLLNEMITKLDELTIFSEYEDKDQLVLAIREKIVQTRIKQSEYQNKMEKGNFSYDDFVDLQEILSLQSFTEKFFTQLKDVVVKQFDGLEEACRSQRESDTIEEAEIPMKYMENAEIELIDFCRNNDIREPEEVRREGGKQIELADSNYYFDYSILGKNIDDEKDRTEKIDKMKIKVKEYASKIVYNGGTTVKFLLPCDTEFNTYFTNVKLKGAGIKSSVLAIIDDRTKKDYDLLLTNKGVIFVDKNKIGRLVDYRNIQYLEDSTKVGVSLGWANEFIHKEVNIAELYNLIQDIIEIA